MNTEALKQGSDEWLNARTGLITGSRVGAILGMSPFAKPEDVLREMVRQHHGVEREFTGNVATEWGQQFEPVAISQYESEYGVIVMEKGFVLHPEYSIFGVSPDGLVGDGMIECKCPYSRKIPDEIPDHYNAQVQLSMDVLGVDWCDFIYWTPDEMKVTRIKKQPMWLAGVLPALNEFYERYQAELNNPAHLEPLVQEMTSTEWEIAVSEYRSAKQRLDDAKADEDKARTALIELAGEKSSKGAGLSLTRIERMGSIDYSKIPEIKGVDLEQYRKKSSTSYRITISD